MAGVRGPGLVAGPPLGTELWEVADAGADALALVDGAVRLTYASARRPRRRLRDRLLDDLGLTRGDRIVVQLRTAGSSWS